LERDPVPKKKLDDVSLATQHLSKVDKKLASLISKIGQCTLDPVREATPYHALMRSIVYQQLHGKAAATILARVHELFSKKRLIDPKDVLIMPVKRLRAAGLSGSKTKAIKDLSQKTIEGIVPGWKEMDGLSNEQIIEQLTQVRGIGPWTVEMLLIFYLGRLDVLPATDYGVRKGFALTYKKKDLPTPKELLSHGEKWQPYRTVAAWYLWRAADLEKLDVKGKK
jgi:DNA-3-methyladenine glycosylase II